MLRHTGLAIVLLFCLRGVYSQNLFPERIHRLLEQLPANSLVVMRSADAPKHDAADYFPESNFYYLTGRSLPGEYLMIAKPLAESLENSCKVFLFTDFNLAPDSEGYDSVMSFQDFRALFEKTLPHSGTFYYSAPDLGTVSDWINAKPLFNEREALKRLREKHPHLTTASVNQHIHKMRMIKCNQETETVRHSIEVTGKGLEQAMLKCRPGMMEYQLQAYLEQEFMTNGCKATAFHSIVASGPNALHPHYSSNRDTLKDGQLVVMDVGARCKGYCADISRTFPVNGLFSPEQKWLYQTVLDCQKELISMVRPGITFKDIDKKAREIFRRQELEKYLIHGVTHSLGIDVHDPQPLDTLSTGMILTIEPGLYIPENDTRYPGLAGTGIRIEDDILVTETGFENLSTSIPKEIAEIERKMRTAK